MPETFLILLAAGVMLAAAVSDPRQVVLRWLRLAGIIALSMAGLSAFFAMRRDVIPKYPLIVLVICTVFILGQLAFVQIAFRNTQRAFAALACVVGILAADSLLPQARAIGIHWLVLANLLCAAVMGLSLMDMLLGHAYLTAAEMTMKPFLRLNRALGIALTLRGLLSIVAAFVLRPAENGHMFWNIFGLYLGTRWLVAFIIGGAFVFMAHDCIKRRATQSATGILYVADVLLFIGEMIGLYLMSETGLPL